MTTTNHEHEEQPSPVRHRHSSYQAGCRFCERGVPYDGPTRPISAVIGDAEAQLFYAERVLGDAFAAASTDPCAAMLALDLNATRDELLAQLHRLRELRMRAFASAVRVPAATAKLSAAACGATSSDTARPLVCRLAAGHNGPHRAPGIDAGWPYDARAEVSHG